MSVTVVHTAVTVVHTAATVHKLFSPLAMAVNSQPHLYGTGERGRGGQSVRGHLAVPTDSRLQLRQPTVRPALLQRLGYRQHGRRDKSLLRVQLRARRRTETGEDTVAAPGGVGRLAGSGRPTPLNEQDRNYSAALA